MGQTISQDVTVDIKSKIVRERRYNWYSVYNA